MTTVLPIGRAQPVEVDPTYLTYVYQTIPAQPTSVSEALAPLVGKYAALLNKTCASVLTHIPVGSRLCSA